MTPAWRKLTAKKFLKMLESNCMTSCPFTLDQPHWTACRLAGRNYGCLQCQEAVGLKPNTRPDIDRCPCYVLGYESLKRAWLFVEDSGILEVKDAPK